MIGGCAAGGTEQVAVGDCSQRGGHLSMEKGERMANLRRGRSEVTEKEVGGSTRHQKIKVLTKGLICSKNWPLYLLSYSAQAVSILMDQAPPLHPGPHLSPGSPETKALLWDLGPHLLPKDSRCGILPSLAPHPHAAPSLALFPLDFHHRWLCEVRVNLIWSVG